MAAFDTTRTTYGSHGLIGRIMMPLTRTHAALNAWNDARATRKALGALSDRELDDIGLNRGDIEAVACGKHYF